MNWQAFFSNKIVQYVLAGVVIVALCGFLGVKTSCNAGDGEATIGIKWRQAEEK